MSAERWAGLDAADVIAHSHEAFVVMDAEGMVRAWNAAAERMFGWSEDEATGSRLSELIIPRRYRDLHERGLRMFLESGVGPVLGTTIEIEGVDRAERLVPVELTISASRIDGEPVFHAFLNEVTHRRRIERLLRAEARVAWLCAEHPGAIDAATVLAAIGTEMDFRVGLAWLPAARPDRLVLAGRWGESDAAAAFAADSAISSFERGVGLPGAAWADGEPIWSTDVSDDPRYIRRARAHELGFRSGVFVPIGRGADCRGVLEFLSSEWRPASGDLIDRIGALGERLGQHVRATPSR